MPNCVAVRWSCRKGGGYRQTHTQRGTAAFRELYLRVIITGGNHDDVNVIFCCAINEVDSVAIHTDHICFDSQVTTQDLLEKVAGD